MTAPVPPPVGYPYPPPAPRKSGVGVLIAVIAVVFVLCCAGGAAVWYFNSFAPARHNQAIQNLFAKIGAPEGFDPDGPPYSNTLHSTVTDIEQSFSLHCAKGVCPFSVGTSIVTWTTRAGTSEVTRDYLNKNCDGTDCIVQFNRGGFQVRMRIGAHADYTVPATTPESKLYQVDLRVSDI